VGRPSFHLVAPEPDEHELQTSCTDMLNILLLPDVCWTAIDHAHSIDQRPGRHGVPIGLLEMRKRKARGVQEGIWDYAFWHRGKSFAVEMKVGDNDLTTDQEVWGRRLIAAGVEVKVCWTKAQLFVTIQRWGLTRPTVMP
jgi:hypothetical protein